MFESGYKYEQVTINKSHLDPNVIREVIFRFKTDSGINYIARIHEYGYRVYAIKFHLREHKNLKKKYNLILNHYFTATNPSRVIRTIVNIAVDILSKDEMASFAFVGVFKVKPQTNKRNKNSKEHSETELTQRFRTYKKIVEYFFGSETFKHNYQEKSNSYLLVNKRNNNYMQLNDEVISLFINIFQDLGDLQ